MTKTRNIAAQTDAVWLVTGCSSGFGRALATALQKKGKKLIATARNVSSLDFLPDSNTQVLKVSLDVTKPDSVQKAIDAGIKRFGRIDVVINNAGIGVIGPIEDVTDEQTRHQFEVNVFGIFNVVRAVTPLFRQQKSGMFINFSSMAGQHSVSSLGVYSASKFAVEGISEALRDELKPYGVSILIVEPGPFDTEWLGKNAIWAEKNKDRYPGVWEYVEQMQGAYANMEVVGDPAMAAEAIISTAMLDNPPFRLALHEFSVEGTRGKLVEVKTDLDRMEKISLNVHYQSKAEAS